MSRAAIIRARCGAKRRASSGDDMAPTMALAAGLSLHSSSAKRRTLPESRAERKPSALGALSSRGEEAPEDAEVQEE